MERPSQIIACGGAMLIPHDKAVLESYVLQATGKAEPVVCFIGTATGDDPTYRLRFYQTYAQVNCRPRDLPLFSRTPADLGAFFAECDVIHVGGGNTRSMLAVWRHWGIDRHLRAAWQRGVVLTGSSAGMICWFEHGVTDSIAGPLTVMDGLGFLPGSACPHFNGEIERRPTYHRMVANGEISAGVAADDGAALHYIGTKLSHVVSVRENAAAYAVEQTINGVHENRLEAKFLG